MSFKLKEFLRKFRVYSIQKGRFSKKETVYPYTYYNETNICLVEPLVSLFYYPGVRGCAQFNIDWYWMSKYGFNDIGSEDNREMVIRLGYQDTKKLLGGNFFYFQSDHTVIINDFCPANGTPLSLSDLYHLIVHGSNLINNCHGYDKPLKIWIFTKYHVSNWINNDIPIGISKFSNEDISKVITNYYLLREGNNLEYSWINPRMCASKITLPKSFIIIWNTDKNFVRILYYCYYYYFVIRDYQFPIGNQFGSLPCEVCGYIMRLYLDIHFARSKLEGVYPRTKEEDMQALDNLSKWHLTSEYYGKSEVQYGLLANENFYIDAKPIFTFMPIHCQAKAHIYEEFSTFKEDLYLHWPLYWEYYSDYIKLDYEYHRSFDSQNSDIKFPSWIESLRNRNKFYLV